MEGRRIEGVLAPEPSRPSGLMRAEFDPTQHTLSSSNNQGYTTQEYYGEGYEVGASDLRPPIERGIGPEARGEVIPPRGAPEGDRPHREYSLFARPDSQSGGGMDGPPIRPPSEGDIESRQRLGPEVRGEVFPPRGASGVDRPQEDYFFEARPDSQSGGGRHGSPSRPPSEIGIGSRPRSGPEAKGEVLLPRGASEVDRPPRECPLDGRPDNQLGRGRGGSPSRPPSDSGNGSRPRLGPEVRGEVIPPRRTSEANPSMVSRFVRSY